MDFIIEIAKQGFGWLVAAYLFVLLLSEKDKRVTDAKEARDQIVEPLKNIQTTLTLLLQSGSNK